MSPTRQRGSTNLGPAFPTQQRTAWWRSHGCIWSFRWTCLHHATESASFCIILHLLCEGPCVISLGVATSAVCELCDLSAGDRGKTVLCPQNFNVMFGIQNMVSETNFLPALCIGALHSTYFICFIMLLLCCETCWIQLRCSALYGKVARATPAIKAASSIPTPTCSNIDLSAIRWSTLSKLMLATLVTSLFLVPLLHAVNNSRLPFMRTALQTLWARANTQGRCAVTPLKGMWALNN